MKKLIIKLIMIYLVLIMFGGIISKIVYKNILLMNIKSYLPDIILAMIAILCLITIFFSKNIRSFKILDLIVVIFTIVVIININSISNKENFLFVMRDLYIPFLTFSLLIKIRFTEKEIRYGLNLLYKVIVSQVIIGFILGVFQRTLGVEWTANFYSGKFFYGIDPISGIKISHANGVLRIPSITGNSASFGFYNLISYFIIQKINIKYKKILIVLSISNIFLSTNKTAIIILILAVIIKIINTKKIYIKFLIVIGSLILFLVAIIITKNIDDTFFFSIKERLEYWRIMFKEINISELIFPNRLFNIGAGSGSGFFAILDNGYIYVLFSYGIIGSLGYILFLYLNLKNAILEKNEIIIMFFVAIIYASMTTNIFQGRVLITPIFLIYIFCENKNILLGKE